MQASCYIAHMRHTLPRQTRGEKSSYSSTKARAMTQEHWFLPFQFPLRLIILVGVTQKNNRGMFKVNIVQQCSFLFISTAIDIKGPKKINSARTVLCSFFTWKRFCIVSSVIVAFLKAAVGEGEKKQIIDREERCEAYLTLTLCVVQEFVESGNRV